MHLNNVSYHKEKLIISSCADSVCKLGKMLSFVIIEVLCTCLLSAKMILHYFTLSLIKSSVEEAWMKNMFSLIAKSLRWMA